MFWLKLISLIFGSLAAATLVGIRFVYAFKDSIHDYYSVPTNHNSDVTEALKNSVNDLKSQIRLSIISQKQDHRKIALMIDKIHNDQKEINKHEKEIQHHAYKIKEHDHDISDLRREKANKKRGNNK